MCVNVAYVLHVCTYNVGSSRQQIHRQLCKLVSDTSLGEILISVQEDGQCEELYRRYIHDFVRSVHKCTHKQNETVKHEYKVCVYRQLFQAFHWHGEGLKLKLYVYIHMEYMNNQSKRC